MHRIVQVAAALLGLVSLACTVTIPSISTVSGSGEIVTLPQDFSDFDRVEIGYAFQATIQQGENFEVVIRMDDNLERDLRVEQIGSTLSIGLDRALGFGLGTVTLEADITMPGLVSLEASGASQVTLSGFESSEPLQIEASGASSVEGEIRAGDAQMEASGASSISLAGAGANLILVVSGASSADLEEFPVTDLRAELSGASEAVVNAAGVLDVQASGASSLRYVGDPQLGSIDTSGASSVEEK